MRVINQGATRHLWIFAAALALSAALGAKGVRSDDATKKPRDGHASKMKRLFNGKNLDGWRTVKKFDFEKHGKVEVKNGSVVLGKGTPASGIAYTGKHLLRMNYEVSLEARRIDGDDFFCGLTFPVGKSHCTLIVGGWGGGVTGLSNIDELSAIDNETTGYTEFKRNRWYKIRLRVTEKKIEAWIGKDQIVDVDTKDRKFSIWWEQEPVRPLGIATWHTKAALRSIEIKPVKLTPKRRPEK